METGFKEHLAVSSSIGLAVVALLGGSELVLQCVLLFMLGSAAPDVDHPKSIPRRVARLSAFSILFFACTVLGFSLFPGCSEPACGLPLVLSAFTLSLSMTMAFEFLVPRHRGRFHTPGAGIFFGLLLFVSTGFFFPKSQALLFGASSAAGYLLHLLVDFVGDGL